MDDNTLVSHSMTVLKFLTRSGRTVEVELSSDGNYLVSLEHPTSDTWKTVEFTRNEFAEFVTFCHTLLRWGDDAWKM